VSQQKDTLNPVQTKKLLPAIKGFNKLAKVFIGILQKRIEAKEKKIANIKLLVNDMPTNFSSNQNHGIIINNIGSEQMTVRKKGQSSFKKKTNWDDIRPSGNKGVLL
jgi:hypothetical protein